MDQGRVGRKPLVTALVYVEGGGNSKALRAECRRGFAYFFEKAGLKGRMPRISACGGRQHAFDDFRHALQNPKNDRFTVLLVDSEEPVARGCQPWEHLKRRDRWERPAAATDDSCHLMVQCMESWFLADKAALEQYFDNGFNRNSLPRREEVEDVSKQDIERGLSRATRQCKRTGAYHKGRHSFAVLAELDPEKVTAASPHAKRLVDTLIANA